MINTKAKELFSLIFTTVRVDSFPKIGESLPDRFTSRDNIACFICGGLSPVREITDSENHLLSQANLKCSADEKWVCCLCSKALIKWEEMVKSVHNLLSQIEDLIQCIKYIKGRSDEPSIENNETEASLSQTPAISSQSAETNCETSIIQASTKIFQQRDPNMGLLPLAYFEVEEIDTHVIVNKGSPFSELEFTDEENGETECLLDLSCSEKMQEEKPQNSCEMITIEAEREIIEPDETTDNSRTNIEAHSAGVSADLSLEAEIETLEKVEVILENDGNPNTEYQLQSYNSGLTLTENVTETVNPVLESASTNSEMAEAEQVDDITPRVRLKRKCRIAAEEKIMSVVRSERRAVENDEESTHSENISGVSNSDSDEFSTDDNELEMEKLSNKKPKRSGNTKSSELTQRRIELRELRRKASKLKCEECGKHFTKVSGFYVHHKEQHEFIFDDKKNNKRTFCCPLCPKKFFHNSSLDVHRRLMHKKGWDGKHPCKYCKKTFDDYNQMKLHRAQECSDILPKCWECGKSFDKRFNLYAHHRNLHENKNEGGKPCHICGKKFKAESTLTLHNKLFHDTPRNIEEDFSCRNCGDKFPTEKDSFTHQLSCRNAICELCDLECTKLYLPRHLGSWMHKMAEEAKRVGSNGDITFSCWACHESFDTVRQLRTHLNAAHRQGLIRCNTCDKQYSSLDSFKKHIKHSYHKGNEMFNQTLTLSEAQEMYFPCCKCSKLFTTSEELTAHESKQHSSEYICEICGKVLFSKHGLGVHTTEMHVKAKNDNLVAKQKRRANPERKQLCKHCPKKFVNTTSLRNHIKLKHWGFKYTCHSCKTSFNSSTTFEKHKKSCGHAQFGITQEKSQTKKGSDYYTGIKIDCQFCGRTLSKKIINSHIELHHFPSKWDENQCPYICGKVLKGEEEWLHHLQNCEKIMQDNKTTFYRCHHCSDTFSCPLQKTSHVLNKHKDSSHKCQHCPLICSTSETLFYHIRSHKELKEHLCQKCGKRFRTHFSLYLHKEAVCNDDEEARQAFLAKRREENRRSIEKKKPFKCPECGKGFVEERRMKAHLTNAHKESENDGENV